MILLKILLRKTSLLFYLLTQLSVHEGHSYIYVPTYTFFHQLNYMTRMKLQAQAMHIRNPDDIGGVVQSH